MASGIEQEPKTYSQFGQLLGLVLHDALSTHCSSLRFRFLSPFRWCTSRWSTPHSPPTPLPFLPQCVLSPQSFAGLIIRHGSRGCGSGLSDFSLRLPSRISEPALPEKIIPQPAFHDLPAPLSSWRILIHH